MKNLEMISVEELKTFLSYDPSTGLVKWALNLNSRARVGREFGMKRRSKRTFYRFGKIHGVPYHTHHVAWAIYYGEWPDGFIDHVNHDGTDNRIENLRVVSVSENNKNMRLRKTNKSGHVGVSWFSRDKKWRVQVSVRGRNTHVGYFDNLEDAVASSKAAHESHGYHANHGAS